MLLLLTLTYCGIVWLVFFKFKWLPWNKGTRNAVILVGIVGLLAVIIGLVQGSPSASGGIQIQARVVGLQSRVQGFVTKIHVETEQRLKKGDPIFEVDPIPYQNKVQALEARLVGTKNYVEQLDAARKGAEADVRAVEADIKVLDATLKGAVAGVESAKAAVDAAKAQHEVALADIARNESNVKTAEIQIPRIREIVRKKVEPQSTLDNAENKVVAAQAGLASARALEVRAREEVTLAEANLKAAKASEQQTRATFDSLKAQLAKAQAAELKARLAAESYFEGEHTSIREVKEQLATARYDLENTVVRAPSDGYVVSLMLSEGFYVRVQQVGTFVNTEAFWALATFEQTTVQYIEAGQPAEIALASMPGRIIPAEVWNVGWASAEAQLPVSGQVPEIQTLTPTSRVAVRFKLLETEGFEPRFSASGTVAVYTDAAQPIGIIRKIILRMNSLLYWLG